MDQLRRELEWVRSQIFARKDLHHSCWYDGGGVSGLYLCEDCVEDRRLRDLEIELLVKLTGETYGRLRGTDIGSGEATEG